MTTDQFVELSVLHDEEVEASGNPALEAFVEISRAIDALPVQSPQSFEALRVAVFSEVEQPSVRNVVFDIFGF